MSNYTKPLITVDVARYDHLLDDPAITPDQRAELLQTLWQLVCEFVALGFSVEPLDRDPCGQIPETPASCPEIAADLVSLRSVSTSHFNKLAGETVLQAALIAWSTDLGCSGSASKKESHHETP